MNLKGACFVICPIVYDCYSPDGSCPIFLFCICICVLLYFCIFVFFSLCCSSRTQDTPAPLIVYFLPDPNPIPGGTTRASPPRCCHLCERKTYMLLLAKLYAYGLVFTHNTTSAFGSPEKEKKISDHSMRSRLHQIRYGPNCDLLLAIRDTDYEPIFFPSTFFVFNYMIFFLI